MRLGTVSTAPHPCEPKNLLSPGGTLLAYGTSGEMTCSPKSKISRGSVYTRRGLGGGGLEQMVAPDPHSVGPYEVYLFFSLTIQNHPALCQRTL